jgi:hypothetical protein
MEPVGVVVPPDLAMFAGNGPGRIGEGPIEILVATDIDAALALNRYAQRPAIWQARFVFDFERQGHEFFAEAHIRSMGQSIAGNLALANTV